MEKYTHIALLSSKLSVGIVGGGESAFLKCRTFSEQGARVEVLAEKFSDKFKKLSERENVTMIKGSYGRSFLEKNHLIIIALGERKTRDVIVEHCEELNKLYLTCDNFRNGKFVTPFQRESSTMSFGLTIKNVSPKTTKYIGEKLLSKIKGYDDYVMYVSGKSGV